jgi:quercetin dioxygenase-like cupin family protein
MTIRSGEVYEHPYERLVVRVGTAESDGRELVADLYVRADAPGVPRHIHPTVAETFTVIRGKVSAWSPDEGERILGPGETLSVPPNTAHGWRPVGDEEVRMLVDTRPGVRIDEMWHQFMGLRRTARPDPGQMPIMPRNFNRLQPGPTASRSASISVGRRRLARSPYAFGARFGGSARPLSWVNTEAAPGVLYESAGGRCGDVGCDQVPAQRAVLR